jgi:hypothetical protein
MHQINYYHPGTYFADVLLAHSVDYPRVSDYRQDWLHVETNRDPQAYAKPIVDLVKNERCHRLHINLFQLGSLG